MFDIDHLYLASFNYHIEDDMGVPTPTTVFDPTEDKNLDKYYQNDLLRCLLTLLTDVDNSMHTLYKSIDNDTELLTEISDLIPETEQIKHNAFNFGTLHEQVLRRNDYITGKVGIGPFALNVTNEVLTYLYGVRFKDSAFTRSTGIDGFDKLLDIDNNYVNQWLSGFINAHVDIIKDPFISKLNTNRFTYNVISLLIRCGFGEAGVWFVSQPIIKKMAQANNVAQSQFVRDTKQYKSQYALQKAMIEDAVKEYLSDELIEQSVLDVYTNNTDRQSVLERIRVVRAIKDKKDLYKLVAMNPTAETVEYNGITYKVADLQRDVFYAWTVLEKYAQALNKLVQYTKIDTRKQGKNFIETAAYLYGYNQLVDPIIDDGVFDLRSIKRMVTSTWIDSKTRRAIGYQSRVLGNKTFTANEAFIDTVVRWAKKLSGSRESLSNDFLNKISRALQTSIKSSYIIGYAKSYLKHDDNYIRGLFIELNDPHHPGTMASRLNRILDAARNNPKYQRLQNNRMLSQLSVVSQEDDLVIGTNIYPKPRFIQVSSNVSNSKSAERVFTEAWLDLLNDEDKFVRSFARDMIIYSFLTSGEYNGWNKLFKYVPEKWLSGEVDTDYQSFSEFVQRALNTDCSGYLSDDVLDEILANNFLDRTFVYPLNQIIDNETLYIISSDKNIAMLAKTSDKKNIKPYVVLRKSDYRMRNAYSVDLYKLFTTIKDKDSHGHVVYIPIYKRILKRGYHNSDHFDIYEYGWNMNYAENWIGEPKEITELDFAKALPQLRAQYNIQSLADNSFVDAISNIDDSNINTVQGDNIAAGKRGTSDLARKLTNKYNNVTVEYKGTLFDNAEHAYQTWKSGQFDQTGFDAHGERGQAKANRNTSFLTMVEIITAKLQQHPELVLEINSRGGLAYLQASTHNVVGDAFWESSGQNGFIRALIQAYNNVTTVSNITPQLRKWVGSTKYYTRLDVANDPTTLYIFTDNTDRTSGGQSYGEGWYKEKYGEGGYGSDRNPTSAIIRGLDNAVPISTMRWFYKNHPGVTHPRTDRNSAARWHDSNFDEFKQVFDDEIQQIKDLWDTGRFRRIVSPVGDMGKSPFFGSQLTEITKERTPRIYEYMLEKFKELQEYVESNSNQPSSVRSVKQNVSVESINTTIATMEGKLSEFSSEEKKSIKDVLGDVRPKVLIASEVTDPVWHANAIEKMVEEELKKPAKQRKFHMMYLITKHDGLPLKKLAKLKIPKFIHFSITSLGGTKYEPGVMKMDDMLDRIEALIKDGTLNPNLITVRIDPIIPGVTTKEDIEHIVSRSISIGIKQFKFSIMDSYGYTESGERTENNRYIIPKMEQLGYDWNLYYGYNAKGDVNFDAKPQYMNEIYLFMDQLAQKYNVFFNTCGERPANIQGLSKIRFAIGCVNVQAMNAALGTTDIANIKGNQRTSCSCYGNKVDALRYDDNCASSCVYCYAKHNSDAAYQYYNEDGTLKDNALTRTDEGTNEQIVQEQPVSMFDDETAQRMYQSWEYMEDSINTTPRTDIKTESHIVTSINGEPVDRDMGKRMYDFVESVIAIIERESKEMVSVPYSEYKNVISNIDSFDSIRSVLLNENWYEEKEIYGKYNKGSKSLTISKEVYDLYKLISKNQDVLQYIIDIRNKTENTSFNFLRRFVAMDDEFFDILAYGTDLFDSVEKETENYSQLDLFQDTAYSDMTQNEQQEAEELMKRCKGGE